MRLSSSSGSIPACSRALLRRANAFTMFQRLGLHSPCVGPLQARHHFARFQMRRDNLGHIGGRDAAIPNPIGINDDNRPVIAQPKAATGGDLNLILQPLRLHFAVESVENTLRAARGTRRYSFRLGLRADKYVVPKRFHLFSSPELL